MRATLMLILAVSMSIQTFGQAENWHASKENDPLHGTSFDKFVLNGEYLRAPEVQTRSIPAFVVLCDRGKFKQGYLDVGAVVAYTGTSPLSGASRSHIEMRFDDRKKTDDDYLNISNDHKALFFNDVQLVKFMTSKLLGHPSDPKALVHHLILGVGEALANQVVIQFDMPQDHSAIIDACGLEWSARKNKK
jgi:hypothetical protein